MDCPITPEAAQVTALHGSLAKTLRLLLGATLPEEELARFLMGLSAPSRALMEAEGPIPDWVPIATVLEAYRALETRLGHAPRALFGRLLVEFEAGKRLFGQPLEDRDPGAALLLLPEAWPLFSRGGCLTLETIGPGQATLWTWASDAYPDIRCQLVAGFILEVLEAAGTQAPLVEVIPAEPGRLGDRFEARWR